MFNCRSMLACLVACHVLPQCLGIDARAKNDRTSLPAWRSDQKHFPAADVGFTEHGIEQQHDVIGWALSHKIRRPLSERSTDQRSHEKPEYAKLHARRTSVPNTVFSESSTLYPFIDATAALDYFNSIESRPRPKRWPLRILLPDESMPVDDSVRQTDKEEIDPTLTENVNCGTEGQCQSDLKSSHSNRSTEVTTATYVVDYTSVKELDKSVNITGSADSRFTQQSYIDVLKKDAPRSDKLKRTRNNKKPKEKRRKKNHKTKQTKAELKNDEIFAMSNPITKDSISTQTRVNKTKKNRRTKVSLLHQAMLSPPHDNVTDCPACHTHGPTTTIRHPDNRPLRNILPVTSFSRTEVPNHRVPTVYSTSPPADNLRVNLTELPVPDGHAQYQHREAPYPEMPNILASKGSQDFSDRTVEAQVIQSSKVDENKITKQSTINSDGLSRATDKNGHTFSSSPDDSLITDVTQSTASTVTYKSAFDYLSNQQVIRRDHRPRKSDEFHQNFAERICKHIGKRFQPTPIGGKCV